MTSTNLDNRPETDRRRLQAEIFGKTKKSPFNWGYSAVCRLSTFGRIQTIHDFFWDDSASDFQPENNGDDSGDEEDVLVKIASAAYLKAGKPQPAGARFALTLEYQLQSIELPLWLSLSSDGQLARSARTKVTRFEKFLGNALDTDGWPLGRLVEQFPLLLASWLRCHCLLEKAGYQISPDAADALAHTESVVARLLRSDRSLMLSSHDYRFSSNAFCKNLTKIWRGKNASPFKQRRLKKKNHRLPAVSALSEWAQLAVLRKAWGNNKHAIAIRFDQKNIIAELTSDFMLLQGVCTPKIKVGGRQTKIVSEIGVSCFHRFDRGEYLELEIELDAGVIARQFLLLTDDRLLFTNDVFRSNTCEEIEYQCSYRLASNVATVKEAENTEVYLKHASNHHLVLPLFLPEWKAAAREGKLDCEDGYLNIHQKAHGCGLATPLVVDLNRKRSQQPRTWRRLTIAERMQTVKPDSAVAYRVQIGNDQWLFYRTIGERGNRTFLGQNFADDFFAGKIDLEGNVESILEIE